MRTVEAGSEPAVTPGSAGTTTPQIGDVLDSRYRITGMLGSGGMGCVYLAEHVAIRRPLALKLLHPEVGGIDEVNRRFEREAFAIGRMDHPNCVDVSDFGRLHDGTLYMVLELLDGVLLSDLLEREERIGWKRAFHIARHVLSALAHAHDAGIIHRDVKPENVILVEKDGDTDFAKILDFGIAKLFEDRKPEEPVLLPSDDPKLTQLGVTIGTPTYIAPEQAFGQPIDGRADLYSLSVMLYEMITGVPPFDADEVSALLRMHASAPVPAFIEAAPDLRVPESVERLVRDGLEKMPDDRTSSAKLYIARIDEIIARETARPSIPPEAASGLREIPAIVAEGVRASLGPAMGRVVTKQKNPKRIVLGLLTVLGLTMLSAFAMGRRAPDYLPGSSDLPLLPPKHGPEAEAAADLLAQGRPEAATAYLMEHRKSVNDEPYAQMVLGHAHATAQRNIQALRAYEKAISLEPDLVQDRLMRTNVELMLHKKAPGVVDAALEFLGMLVSATGDRRAEDQLVDLASFSKVSRTRHQAVAVAEEVGIGDRIDRLSSYLLDLERGATCADRKDAVAKLRALGNNKAIPDLRKARKRIRTEGLLKRKVNTNACLRVDATEAIRYLQSL
ncbi:MAG TPA: serine/threonine-protein kinase [Polyangiales bacterium]|nr:serine/threonine-protein kinase [Polyangiales bacterium]